MENSAKYYIKTYGCQMNIHESEKIAGMLKSMGYTDTLDMNEADIIVYNTCCIRDGVEKKIEGNIGNVKRLKKNNPNLIFAICGCMSQMDGKSDYLQKKFPYIDIVIGTHNLNELKSYIMDYNSNRVRIADIKVDASDAHECTTMVRDGDNFNAWVNIIYGCNNFCTYCIVPYVRGRERSRSISDIKTEVESLVHDGYKYITLLGQNVNSYGNDLADGTNFAKLLNTLCEIEGDFRLKFMTSHPKDLSDEVIDCIANNDKICKIIHLPVQSGSNKILKAMNRNYTREKYLDIIKHIRNKIPNCYISTDIIVGFPGEDEKDFLDTVDLVKQVRFDGVFAFMYSKRSGTPASNMPNQIDESVKNERVNTLLHLTKQITKELDDESLGKIYECVITSASTARTHSGKVIQIDKTDLLEKQFCNVQITNTKSKIKGKVV